MKKKSKNKRKVKVFSNYELAKIAKDNSIEWSGDNDGSSFIDLDKKCFKKWVRVSCRRIGEKMFFVTFIRKSELNKILKQEVDFEKTLKLIESSDGEEVISIDRYYKHFENVYAAHFGIYENDLYVNAYDYICDYALERKKCED